MRYATLLLAAGCGPRFASGASEPFQVRHATFFEGALPEDPEATTPAVLNAGATGAIVTQGQASMPYTGLVTKDAYSVAVTMPDFSSGYWVIAAGGPDVTQDGNLLFDLVADFSVDVGYGIHTVAFTALDEQERPSALYSTSMCILPDVADNALTACEPTIPPDAATLSLSWDTPVDLDLVVVTPAGKVVSAKSPTTVSADATIPSEEVNDPSTGKITRDSNANCVIDGIQIESLVFAEAPASGDYEVYANLFGGCDQPVVHYTLRLTQRVDQGDGTWSFETETLAVGELLPVHQNNGSSLGTHVTTVTFP